MIYFLLCAYNESKNIVSVIQNIRENIRENIKQGYKIIIVNDGSTDDTLLQIKKIQNDDIIVLNHDKNLGLGLAIKTGIKYLSNVINEDDIVITMDADNTHPVEVVYQMLQEYAKGNEVIIASRYCPGGQQLGVPLYRKFISWSAKLILTNLFPYKNVRDYTSGYRLYSGRVVKNLIELYEDNFITQKNFVVQLEILVKLFKINPKVAEVPLKIEYYKKYGKSKLKIIKNLLSYIETIFVLKFIKKL